MEATLSWLAPKIIKAFNDIPAIYQVKKKPGRSGFWSMLMEATEYYIIDGRPEMKEQPAFLLQSKTLADNICRAMNLAYRVGITEGIIYGQKNQG